jgi:hypothetical protein
MSPSLKQRCKYHNARGIVMPAPAGAGVNPDDRDLNTFKTAQLVS